MPVFLRSGAALALFALAACSTDAGDLGTADNTSAAGQSPGAAGGAKAGAGGASVIGAGGALSSSGAGGALEMADSNSSVAGGGHAGASGSSAMIGGAPAGGDFAAGGSAGIVSGDGGGNSSAGTGGIGGTSSGTGGGRAYFPCPATAGPSCAVLPLGDSITEGFGSSGAGYRVELFSQAAQHGKALTFVGSLQNGPNTVQNKAFPKQHEGHDGYTIGSGTGHSGISGSITDQAIANYHPNIVLLMIGTNDINGNIDVANAPNRVGDLIDDITTRAPNALVVVATIIPVANAGTNPKVKTYNAALAGVVNARASAGKHVVLVDNYAAFSRDPNYQTSIMYDYLHPNDAGYAVLGRSFYSVIGPLLPSG